MLRARIERTDNALIVKVRVKKIPEDGILYVVYGNNSTGTFRSRSVCVASMTTHSVPLVRLRAKTKYLYRVVLEGKSKKIYQTRRRSFTTKRLPKTLRDSFTFTLKGSFSDAAGVIILCINGVSCTPNFFQGYIGVDQQGKIVWYYQAPKGTPVAGDFFQLQDGNFLITIGQSLGVPIKDAQIFQAAQMLVINALGQSLAKQPLVCETFPNLIGVKDAVLATFPWTHAAWQDPANPSTIFNLGLTVKDPYFNAGLLPPGQRLQLGNTIRSWTPCTNEQRIHTTSFDFENPILYRGSLSNNPLGEPIDCKTPPGLPNVEDWVHGNAISRLHGKSPWVISQRNTSSVCIFSPSFKLLYKFGVTLPSDFTFATPNDLFYGQHDAHEIPRSSPDHVRLLMFDDGTGRPTGQGGPYARGIEYDLDLKKAVIRKVWEFRPRKDIQCNDGGSSRRLSNGHTIVDFGATNLTVKHVFEALRESNQSRAELQVQAKSSNTWLLYRAIPVGSLFGETQIDTPN
jgi:hypothetical protein